MTQGDAMTSTAPKIAAILLVVLLQGCLLFSSNESRVPDEHVRKVLSATAAAEQDLKKARRLMKEKRYVDALRTVLNRLKILDTQIYDEQKLKSKAYQEGHLPTVRVYATLLEELQEAENALLLYLNEPLTYILQNILLKHPDPRAREEALDILAGSANEVFTRFQAGYRKDLLDSLEVRIKGEEEVTLRTKMKKIIDILERH